MSVSGQQTGPSPSEVWSTGDYADVCERMIPGLGARLVELAEVQAGEHVLDVATGSGNAALPAARVGARVTALDITPALLEVASRRANSAGLNVTWVHGDAQSLPFHDNTFDRVLSCVGVQFCPDQLSAAAELVRVCRPGGRIALIAWTPEGFLGQVLAAVSTAVGGARSGSSPLAWGREDSVRELFEDCVTDIVLHREHVEMPAASAVAWVDYMASAYGPLVRARTALQARDEWAPLRGRLAEIANTHRARTHGPFTARAEYLTALLYR